MEMFDYEFKDDETCAGEFYLVPHAVPLYPVLQIIYYLSGAFYIS